MRNLSTPIVAVVLAFTTSTSAQAQRSNELRRFDAFWAPYSYYSQNEGHLHGSSYAFAIHLNQAAAVVAEFGQHSGRESLIAHLTTYRFGPRFSWRRGSRFTLFGHTFVGGARLSGEDSRFVGPTVVPTSQPLNGFAFTIGGGLDVGIRRWIAIRAIQGDYSRTRFGNSDANANGLKLGGGVVVRFGS